MKKCFSVNVLRHFLVRIICLLVVNVYIKIFFWRLIPWCVFKIVYSLQDIIFHLFLWSFLKRKNMENVISFPMWDLQSFSFSNVFRLLLWFHENFHPFSVEFCAQKVASFITQKLVQVTSKTRYKNVAADSKEKSNKEHEPSKYEWKFLALSFVLNEKLSWEE